MKPSLNRQPFFKLIVHGIELYAAFSRKKKINKIIQSYLSFSTKLHYAMFININLVTVFTNKDFHE